MIIPYLWWAMDMFFLPVFKTYALAFEIEHYAIMTFILLFSNLKQNGNNNSSILIANFDLQFK